VAANGNHLLAIDEFNKWKTTLTNADDFSVR